MNELDKGILKFVSRIVTSSGEYVFSLSRKGSCRVLITRYISHGHLALAISRIRISIAPTAVNSSITVAIRFFSTIELTATQASSSSAVMVGARLPGVYLVASSSNLRSTLYWQRTNFWAA